MIKILKIDEDIHTEIKIASAKANMTMKDYIRKLVVEKEGVSYQPFDSNENYTKDCILERSYDTEIGKNCTFTFITNTKDLK